jgi:hypothetical protein
LQSPIAPTCILLQAFTTFLLFAGLTFDQNLLPTSQQLHIGVSVPCLSPSDAMAAASVFVHANVMSDLSVGFGLLGGTHACFLLDVDATVMMQTASGCLASD